MEKPIALASEGERGIFGGFRSSNDSLWRINTLLLMVPVRVNQRATHENNPCQAHTIFTIHIMCLLKSFMCRPPR